QLAVLGTCAFLGGAVAVWSMAHLGGRIWAQVGENDRLGGAESLRLSERFEAIARQVSPAVVYVEAAKPTRNGKAQPLEESGSGVIVRWPGQNAPLVLTNNHVIARAAPEQITVNLSDGRLF